MFFSREERARLATKKRRKLKKMEARLVVATKRPKQTYRIQDKTQETRHVI